MNDLRGESMAEPRAAAEQLIAVLAPQRSVSVESQAIYAALLAGTIGAVVGLVVGLAFPPMPLHGDWSLGNIVAIAAGVAVGVTTGVGYWRMRYSPGQEWRLSLRPFTFSVNAVAVVSVHVVLTVISVLAAFLVLSKGFVGLLIDPFWATALSALFVGLSAYVTYLSIVLVNTQRMSTLLMAFVTMGTFTAMVTTPDPQWWKLHFSELGTFWSISSLVFNGTLVVGGLLLTTFAVYLSHDLQVLVERGVLAQQNSAKVISRMFIVMGLMIAGVGIVPVNVSLIVHNTFASGMAVMFFGMLVLGPKVLRGMPRAYFISAWIFLASVVVSVLLFAVGYFGLTALEIIVFALIFGWISVFIRFLGATGQVDRGPQAGSGR
ncbi:MULTISPECIES: hypothetical protein [unclassified Leucobacter]|uniref:hypothetical protein n=1 Tax=unclassified Leucobacter TaxID=2621730 RepID=UPI001F13B0DA|nr:MULTISPECIES: hypothetical protein [unclassified Leucobacter]